MKRKNSLSHHALLFLSLLVASALVAGCASVERPRKSIQQQADDNVTVRMCSNVYGEYIAGTVTDEELLFVYKPNSIALIKSDGVYLRNQDKELCIYLKFYNLEQHKKHILRYTMYDPDNNIYDIDEYSFTPDSIIWHAWNTKELIPEDRKRMVEGSWIVKVTLDGKPVADKVFKIHSTQDADDLAHKQLDESMKNQMVQDIVTEKILRNCAFFFCDNDCYRGCYDLNRSRCIEELDPIVATCVERTEKQLELQSKGGSSFWDLLAVCVQVKHVLVHSELDLKTVSECVTKCPVDEDDAVRALLQR